MGFAPLDFLGTHMTSTQDEAKIDNKISIKEPQHYRVIYMNDDTTSLEFVVSSLVTYFAYDEPAAGKLCSDIHESGSAVVAILPYEIAEQKGIEVTMLARQHGFPLQIRLESNG